MGLLQYFPSFIFPEIAPCRRVTNTGKFDDFRKVSI